MECKLTEDVLTSPRFLTRDDASAYIRRVYGASYKPETLQYFDLRGKGPGSFKLGKQVVYSVADIDRWIEARMKPSNKRRVSSIARECP
jgi:hypothetical protein